MPASRRSSSRSAATIPRPCALKAKGEPAPTNHSPFFAPQAEPAIRNAVTAIVLSIVRGVRPAEH